MSYQDQDRTTLGDFEVDGITRNSAMPLAPTPSALDSSSAALENTPVPGLDLSSLTDGMAVRIEVVFIEDNLPQWQGLVQGVRPGVEVVVLDSQGDGLAQMAEWLANKAPGSVDAIHLLSHGSSAAIQLGSLTLDDQTLAQSTGRLDQIGAALSDSGDFLVYGCNVAQGQTGLELVAKLAQATGADVAASVDTTGAATLGGNWQLEQHTGPIAVQIPFTQDSLEHYSARLTTITVTNANDSGAGSLRQALADALAGDTINFDPALSGSTIVLTGGPLFTVKINLTIDGDLDNNGTPDITLDGNNNYQVMVNQGYAGLLLDGLTLTRGRAAVGGGGALQNHGSSTTLRDCVVSNSATSPSANGGGIFNVGTLTLVNSTVSGNSTLSIGGGIFSNNGTLTLVNSTVSGNSATLAGGGIYNNYGTLTLVNSTVSGNSADIYGGIELNGGTATLSNSTITANSQTNNSNGALNLDNAATATLNNTVVAGNTGAAADVKVSAVATLTANYSYFGTAVSGTFTNTNSINGGGTANLLGPLANNGGLVQTHKPLPGSALINAGSSALLPVDTYDIDGDSAYGEPLPLDAAGHARVLGSALDIGAMECSAAPVISNLAGDTLAFTEDASAAVIDQGTAAAVADTDSGNFATGTLTVSIVTNRTSTEDVLAIRNQGTGTGQIGFSGSNITYGGTTIGTFTGGSSTNDLVITFNASATPAIAQALIQNITYKNTNTIDPSTAARTVRFVLNDGAGGASTNTDTTVNVTAVNDAPTLTANGSAPTFTEHASAVTLFSSSGISTQEPGQTLTGLTLTVTNVSDTTERLDADGSTINLTHGASGTTTTNSMAYAVSVAGGTATLTLTKAGGISTAAMGVLVDGIAYSNTSHAPSTASNRVITITSVQDSGGVASGGVDASSPTGTPGAATVTVVGVNDPPVLDATQSPALTAIAHNISDSANTGTSVGTMVVNGSITDADIIGPATAPKAIIVETVDNTNGVWQFKVGAGSWTNFDTGGTPLNATTGTGIVLASTDLIRFVPTADYAGNATITFFAWDTTDAKASGTYTTFVSNTAAGYSLASDTASVTVLPQPTITSATYDASSGVLSVTGTDLPALAGAANDIDVSKLTLSGEGGDSRTLTSTSVEITSATSFTVTLNAQDKAAVGLFINKNLTSSTGGTLYNLGAAEDWAAGANAADVIADLTGNGVTASNVPVPSITSATYDTGTGVLAVAGAGFLKLNGAANDIDISKLTFTGQGAGAGAGPGAGTYTLTSASDVDITSGTSFSVTLSGADKTAVNALLNKDGATANDGSLYNLGAAEDWAAGANAAVTVADATGNGITVSVYVDSTDNGDSTTPTDADGVSDAVEASAPGLRLSGGGNTLQGDGNGDGVQDSQQSNVTSVPFQVVGTYGSAYVTLVADSKDGKIDSTDGNNATLNNVRQLDAPANLPANIKMPLGLISFSSNVGASGTAETFSLYVDPTLGINAYWKLNKAGTWVNIASAEYGGKVVTEGGKTRLDFKITDGGEFDSDGKTDGIITDPGAPGFSINPKDTDNDQFPDALEAANGLTVGVKDNNVFTSSKFFAMQLYRDILYREGDNAGIQYWQGRIDAGMSRSEVAVAVLDSPEFQAGTGAIARLYFGSLNRLPDAAGMTYWVDQQKTGSSITQIANAFAASSEFTAMNSGLSDSAFIQKQYQTMLGRAATPQEQTQWGSQLSAGANRGAVLLGLTESAEYKVASDTKLSVALDYLGLLGRTAEQTGFDYWVNQQSTTVPEVTVVGGFIASVEYHDRFLP